MFAIIQENDQDWEEKLAGFKYIARTQGCGCCAEWLPLTRENLEQHIQDLQEQLEKAQGLLSEV